MGRPDNAQSCLSPGGRADRGKVGGGGTGDKNDSMASAPMVWRPWEEEQLGRSESRTSATMKAHMVAAVCIVVVVVPGGEV